MKELDLSKSIADLQRKGSISICTKCNTASNQENTLPSKENTLPNKEPNKEKQENSTQYSSKNSNKLANKVTNKAASNKAALNKAALNKEETINLHKKKAPKKTDYSEDFKVPIMEEEPCFNNDYKKKHNIYLKKLKETKANNIQFRTPGGPEDAENNTSDNEENYNFCYSCNGNLDNNIIFKLCNSCLRNTLKSQLLSTYINFLYTLQSIDVDFKKKWYEYLKNRKISLSYLKSLQIMDVFKKSNVKISEIFKEVKEEICPICTEKIGPIPFFILPCGCRFCKIDCHVRFFTVMMYKVSKLEDQKVPEIIFPYKECICGHEMTFDDYYKITKDIFDKNINESDCYYDNLRLIVKSRWKWMCMSCSKVFNEEENFLRVVFRDEKILDFYKEKLFKHLICRDCLQVFQLKSQYNINKNVERQYLFCEFCKSEHEIIEIKHVSKSNKTQGGYCNIL